MHILPYNIIPNSCISGMVKSKHFGKICSLGRAVSELGVWSMCVSCDCSYNLHTYYTALFREHYIIVFTI